MVFQHTDSTSFLTKLRDWELCCAHAEAGIIQIFSISITRGEYQMEPSLAIFYLVFLRFGTNRDGPIGILLLFSANL
jgi:hypothetical protein